MKPCLATIYRYSIPFLRPVPVRRSSLGTRDGFLLALRSPGGHTGFGEIAPLPGLHEETLEQAGQQLTEFLRRPLQDIGNLTIGNVADSLPKNLFPSVLTGIEMALLNLQAGMKGAFPLPQPYNRPAKILPLNALLFGDTPTVLEQAAAFSRQGYRTFKLKVNAHNAEAASEQLNALNRTLPKDALIRLDSNRSFGLAEAASFLDTLPKERIAYIEEPLRRTPEIPELFRRTGVRSALDESLWQHPGIHSRLPTESLGGFVLKPSRIGGVAATVKLAAEAHSLGLPAVIGSAFETGVSLGFFVRIASLLDPDPPACGLDTFRQFRRDILAEPLTVEGGNLSVEEAYRKSLRPEFSMLKTVGEWTL